MRGLGLKTLGAVLLLGLVVWGLARTGASDDAIVFGVIGFGLALIPWVAFWLARRRAPGDLDTPIQRRRQTSL